MSRFWNSRKGSEGEPGDEEGVFRHELLQHVQITSQATDQVLFLAERVIDLTNTVKMLEEEKSDILARLEKLEASQN